MAIKRRNSDARRPAQIAQAGSPAAEASRSCAYGFSLLIAAGILLRVLVFAFMGYFNNDNHIAVIEYVARYWTPPHATQFNQALSPAALLLFSRAVLASGWTARGPELVSALFDRNAASHRRSSARPSMDEASFSAGLLRLGRAPSAIRHVQPVHLERYAGDLSRRADFLSMPVRPGTPLTERLRSVGSFLGVGLLTKAVFLVFVPPLAMFVGLDGNRQRLLCSQAGVRLATMLSFAGVLGCYKYVENLLLFSSLMINNLDFADWIAEQRPTWTGMGSLLDFNIFKLVGEPIASASTVHSYPLMLYGSFWYAFLTESTFRGNLLETFDRIGSLIYLAALWPTVLMAIGAGRIGASAFKALSSRSTSPIASSSERNVFEATVILTLLLNIALVVLVGWQYDVWSVFQGHLIFPAYLGVLVALNSGLEWTESSRLKANLTRCTLASLMGLFLSYFATEFWLASAHPTNPLSMDHMPYKIDMKAQ
jgi:hypothetical protein